MSKSVRLKTTDATTGTTKKTAISTSAGATNAHPGSRGRARARPAAAVASAPIAARRALEDPAALLEDRVDVAIERREGVVERRAAANRRLDVLADGACDALPLRDLRRRPDVLELDRERLRAPVAAQERIVPRVAARREVAREPIERQLLRRLGEILDEAPCRVGVRRPAREREARAAGERHAWVRRVGAGKRRRRPRVRELRRQAARELAEVPRPGDVEREVALCEVLIDV